ncbi:MAG: hypothetical protein JSS49_08400 [Planctomycetes bacterium]|nr:hypothetical protein [Planctomycetota bacterium]
MQPITERDVVRFLEGMIDDPDEARRVLDAIDDNPQLAGFASWLTETEDAETPRQVPPDLFPSLKHSRLWRLANPPHWAELSEGGTVTTVVEFVNGDTRESFPLTLTRRGNSLEISGHWPSGWRPFGFVLAKFDFAKGRIDPEQGLVSFSMSIPRSEIRPISEIRTAAERNVGEGRTAEPLRVAAAKSADAKTAARSSVMSQSRFRADRKGRSLTVMAAIPEGQNGDLVIAELHSPGAVPICFPIQVERRVHPVFGEVHVPDFPWPDVAGPVDPTLTIRPLTDADLPLLNDFQVSSMLSWQQGHFCFVPIHEGADGGKKCEFRYVSEIEAAHDRKSTWLLRMVLEGGDK